jgi:class 3 adenylate cyclase
MSFCAALSAPTAGTSSRPSGDAFCAAFHTAADGLAAALDAQRALHVERWAESVQLRVRMALHIGAVEMRDGDYFGAPLNRVARLLSAGHGGQTLLTESMRDLCRDHLPPLASVKALGEHGLRDLARCETVFQLCHRPAPGLSTAEIAGRTLDKEALGAVLLRQ